MRLHIIGGHLIDPANAIDSYTDIAIANGKIAAIGPAATAAKADQTLDASGLVVCPGLVDLSACLPEPGHEHKGSIASETRAAANGGITSLCCPPDTQPVIDSASVATLIQDLARQSGFCRVWPVGALTQGLQGSKLSEMGTLKEAGCIAMSNLRAPFENNRVLLRSLEYAASYNVTVFFNSVEHALAEGGCVHEGRYATRLGLKGIPETAETVALSRDLLLVEQTGVRAHFGQVSCARSVELIASAQQKGLPVTADVGIYHLLASEASIDNFNSLYHLQPPLRTETDRQALREGLRDGVICAISSHHRPHEMAAKMAPFAATEPGISSLETLLPQALQLVEAGLLDLPTLIARLTSGPARVARIAAGALSAGDNADICIFDPEQSWRLTPDALCSKGHNTPLLGSWLAGRVHHTLLGGRRVGPAPA